jgi:hypothetical protein
MFTTVILKKNTEAIHRWPAEIYTARKWSKMSDVMHRRQVLPAYLHLSTTIFPSRHIHTVFKNDFFMKWKRYW